MKFDIQQTAKDHRIVVAHRGVAGGNIPCNTMTAYETALKQGADMIETDLDFTADGKLVIFHPGMERNHLFLDKSIEQMPWNDVKNLRYVNNDNCYTQFGILTFDELLETFKGRCYINIDKFWGNPANIYKAIKAQDMVDQCLVKSGYSEEVIRVLEELCPEIPFMPVVSEEHPTHELLKSKNINYVGAEVLFSKEDSTVCSPEFMDMMHRENKLVWVNSIIYDYKAQLAAGHSDDSALSESMDYGWGWLADRGFDMIQTDWPLMLINYLKETGKYYL